MFCCLGSKRETEKRDTEQKAGNKGQLINLLKLLLIPLPLLLLGVGGRRK